MSKGNFFRGSLYTALVAALVLSIPPAGGRSQRRRAAGLDANRLEKISARMNSFVEQGRIAGAVMLVDVRDGAVSLRAVGYKDVEAGTRMPADAIFDIRSVTKPVTAIGIMILMEDGKLSLDDPVEKYLPEFKTSAGDASSASAPITIHHLLTHTGGLPARPPEIEDITIRRDRTLAEVVALLSKQRADFAPGTQFRYASSGFAVLGRVIEVVSGKPYERFVKERVFDPLGMKDSFFLIPAEKFERVAPVYRLREGKLERWEEIREYSRKAKYPAPEFGMYSTASDLHALCRMMLDGGTYKGRRVLSKASVEAMTTNHTLGIKSAPTGRPAHQGLGWGLSGDHMSDFPLTSQGSYGHNGAFGSIVWVDPKTGLVRIFLQHLFGSVSEVNVFMAMAGASVTE